MIREGLEWTLWDTPLNLEEQASAPTVVPANTLKIYAKDKSGVSALYWKDDALVEHDLSAVVTGTGVANQIALWATATSLTGDADLTFLTDTLSTTKLKVGSGVTDDTESAIFKIKANSIIDAPHFFRFGTSGGGFWVGVGARGTIAAPSQTLANDTLSGVSGRGYDNQATPALTGNSAVVALKAGENFTSTARGAYITLETTPLLSITRAVRFRVGESGQWGIGGATYGAAGNLFRSGGASAAPTWLDHTTDFLSQYALLAGRVGSTNDIILSTTTQGQLAGSLASGQNLKLTSSTHATKAKILFGASSAYDEVNVRLGIRQTTPLAGLHINGNKPVSPGPGSNFGVQIGNNDTDDEWLINTYFSRLPISTTDNLTANQYTLAVQGGTGQAIAHQTNIGITGTAARGQHYGNLAIITNSMTGGSISGITAFGIQLNMNTASGHNITTTRGLDIGTGNLFAGTNTFTNVEGLFIGSCYGGADVSGTNYAIHTEGGRWQLETGNAAEKGMIVKAAASQTANLQEWQNSSAVPLAIVGPGGIIGCGNPGMPTTGTAGIVFADGTALATMATNTAGLYADDIAGNVSMHAINEDGTIIKLYQQANSVALDDLVINNGLRASGGAALFTAQLKFVAGNEATGAQTPLLGANAPGTGAGLTNPYTWFKMTSSDGSQVYVPAWKLS